MQRFALILSAVLLVASAGTVYAQGKGNKPDDPLLHALQQLQQAHQNHLDVLNGLLNQVPPQARKGILNAIENSQKGLNNAQAALQRRRAAMAAKGKGKPAGVGKGKPPFAGKGKPPGVGKGKGKGKPAGVGRGKGKGKPGGAGRGKGKGRGRGKP